MLCAPCLGLGHQQPIDFSCEDTRSILLMKRPWRSAEEQDRVLIQSVYPFFVLTFELWFLGELANPHKLRPDLPDHRS